MRLLVHYGISSYSQPLSDADVLRRHGHLVRKAALAVATRIGGDAEALWAAGAVGLLEAVRRFDPSSKMTVENFASQRIRKAMIEEVRRKKTGEGQAAEQKLERLLLESGRESGLKRALSTLPENQQTVLSLRYVEELTVKEIVAILGMTEPNVQELHNAAVSSLKQILP